MTRDELDLCFGNTKTRTMMRWAFHLLYMSSPEKLKKGEIKGYYMTDQARIHPGS